MPEPLKLIQVAESPQLELALPTLVCNAPPCSHFPLMPFQVAVLLASEFVCQMPIDSPPHAPVCTR